MLTLAAVLAVACSEHGNPTGPEQAVTDAEFNFMNGPEAPGAVYRETGTFHFYFVVWDFDRQLWAEVTNDQGNNPGGGTWLVQVSNDGGSSWSTLASNGDATSNPAWANATAAIPAGPCSTPPAG